MTPDNSPDAPALQDGSDAAIAAKRSAKLRLTTLASLDGRTKAARLVRSLVDSIESDLGGADRLSIGERQIVQRAAVLGAVLESMEAAWLAGEAIDLATYTTALNAQRRQLEAIGLKRRPRDVTPDLNAYIAGRSA